MLVADTRHEPDWVAARGAEEARSWFATPLIAGGSVIGVLAIHKAQPAVFTAEHQHVAEALAGPAAVAIQNARLHERVQTHARELEPRVTELSRTERALRRSQAYLAAAQRLSHTGSWGWEARDESDVVLVGGAVPDLRARSPGGAAFSGGRTGLLPSRRPREHAELYETVIREKVAWEHHPRILLPDGTLKYVRSFASPVLDTEGNLVEFVGMVMDVTEHKRALNALSEAQAELAHVTRVTTLGEVTASFAHEVNQPLAAIVNNANACLGLLPRGATTSTKCGTHWLTSSSDAERASAIIERVRGLAKRSPPEKVPFRLGGRRRRRRGPGGDRVGARRVTIRTDVAARPPRRAGRPRAAPAGVAEPGRERHGRDGHRARSRSGVLEIRGRPDAQDGSPAVPISVQDHGIGLSAGQMERLFEAFYTTKPHGMGLGLAISRSIIEAHGGRLWAEPNSGAGRDLLVPSARGRTVRSVVSSFARVVSLSGGRAVTASKT